MSIDPIARSGHLTDLGLECLHAGALQGRARWRGRRHLQGCALCRERLEALGPAVRPARTRPAAWPWAVGTGTVLAAAAALLFARPPPPAAFVVKGAPELEIWVHDGQTTHALAEHEAVGTHQSLGFRVAVRERSWVLLFTVDAQGDRSVVFPAHAEEAAEIEPRASRELLPVAVSLDEGPGDEWFHAVVCPLPFDLQEARRIAAAGDPRPCTHLERRVPRAEEP